MKGILIEFRGAGAEGWGSRGLTPTHFQVTAPSGLRLRNWSVGMKSFCTSKKKKKKWSSLDKSAVETTWVLTPLTPGFNHDNLLIHHSPNLPPWLVMIVNISPQSHHFCGKKKSEENNIKIKCKLQTAKPTVATGIELVTLLCKARAQPLSHHGCPSEIVIIQRR